MSGIKFEPLSADQVAALQEFKASSLATCGRTATRSTK
jgi:hypothetical protein